MSSSLAKLAELDLCRGFVRWVSHTSDRSLQLAGWQCGRRSSLRAAWRVLRTRPSQLVSALGGGAAQRARDRGARAVLRDAFDSLCAHAEAQATTAAAADAAASKVLRASFLLLAERARTLAASGAAASAAAKRSLRLGWRCFRVASLCSRASAIANRHARAFDYVVSLRRALLRLSAHQRCCRAALTRHVSALTWSRRNALLVAMRCLRHSASSNSDCITMRVLVLRTVVRQWAKAARTQAAIASTANLVTSRTQERRLRRAFLPWARACRLTRHRSRATVIRRLSDLQAAIVVWRQRAEGASMTMLARRHLKHTRVRAWRKSAAGGVVAHGRQRAAAAFKVLRLLRTGFAGLRDTMTAARSAQALTLQAIRAHLRTCHARLAQSHRRRKSKRERLADLYAVARSAYARETAGQPLASGCGIWRHKRGGTVRRPPQWCVWEPRP